MITDLTTIRRHTMGGTHNDDFKFAIGDIVCLKARQHYTPILYLMVVGQIRYYGKDAGGTESHERLYRVRGEATKLMDFSEIELEDIPC